MTKRASYADNPAIDAMMAQFESDALARAATFDVSRRNFLKFAVLGGAGLTIGLAAPGPASGQPGEHGGRP